QKVNFTGPIIAGLFTVLGFAFFGKNLLNSMPIIFGVYLYAKLEHKPFSNYMLPALFGTALSPAVSTIMFGKYLPLAQGLLIGTVVGIVLGLVIPPLSAHFLHFHQGFNLYNIGFTAGIVGMLLLALMNKIGFHVETVSILSSGNNFFFASFITGLSLFLIIGGLLLNGMRLIGYGKLTSRSGKLLTNFVELDGVGLTAFNMGVLGLIAVIAIFALGGDFNGPILGGIFTLMGFGAFGKHPKNCLPIMTGVLIASLINPNAIPATNLLLALLFGTTLAPLAGRYGVIAGVFAGFVHLSLVANVGFLHGGMNLYNNGFAGGLVALFLKPIYDAILSIKSRRIKGGFFKNIEEKNNHEDE
ncbi:MAG: DUF1576 domain-containing protein, partial [Streptococcaceae bacterium]|nr:DUF1576 domain-containing protein [Streptococcaceae bacterium]